MSVEDAKRKAAYAAVDKYVKVCFFVVVVVVVFLSIL